MGSEFIPSLDEGDIACTRCASPAPAWPGRRDAAALERGSSIPEVERVFAKIGTAEVATDPMPPSVADTFVIMKPRAEWPDPRKPKAQLVAEIEAACATMPGNNYEFTQPIQMRFNELISGVRADVAVKVYGDDLDTLVALGEAHRGGVGEVPGAADVKPSRPPACRC
jgi:heavy metal efflux system protein